MVHINSLKEENQLTHRERVLAAISHQKPDRVPIDLGGFQTGMAAKALKNLLDLLGMGYPIEISDRVQQLGVVPEPLLQQLGVDTRYVFPNGVNSIELEGRDAFRDEWGIIWEKRPGVLYYEMVSHPLSQVEDLSQLSSYHFPKPEKEKRTLGLQEKAQAYRRQDYALFTSIAGVYDQVWNLLGLEKFFVDTIQNRDFIVALYKKVMNCMMELYGVFFEEVGEYLDVVEIWQDLTNQRGPMISPEFYRKYLKPLDQHYIHFIQSKTSAHIALHCCGAAVYFIPDLIDIGVEILNPIQVSAQGMDTRILKRDYGKDLVFWGAIDTQYILPRGTVEEVKAEVKKRIDDLAVNGGYILASVHNIQADVPPQNIIAMFETALNYGKG